MQKIRFRHAKDKVSPCKRYGFVDWEISFWTSKKTKNRVILHWFCYLPVYQMVTERQPTLEPTLKPTLNPHWNPHWKILFWDSGRLTLVSQNPGDDDTNETNYMYGLMTISEIPLQRYNKKTPFPNFREYLPHILRQSVIHVNRWRHCGASEQDAATPLLKIFQQPQLFIMFLMKESSWALCSPWIKT